MTRPGALPHRVDLIPRGLTERNARNNEVRVDEPELEAIPARVDVIDIAEEDTDRERRIERIAVILPYQWRGDVLDLDSVDALRFAGNVYELKGPAAQADDHAGRHEHFHLEAERIVG